MKRTSLLAVFGSVALVLPGAGRSFSIPEKVAAPGSDVEFPVTLDNAAGCASIQLQVNFDPQILEFQGFVGGEGLGSQFEATAYHENGVAVLVWTRANNLVSGNGSLGRMKFKVNSGASHGLKSPLAIADCEMSDASGTVQLSLTSVSGNQSGSLVVGGSAPDGDGDGMPDSWETLHSLNPQVAGGDADTDQDGRSDFLEYALGGDPRVKDPARTPATVAVSQGGAQYLALAFNRRINAGLSYRVWESPQLANDWSELDIAARLAAPPVDNGDGTERVIIRSNYRMQGPGPTQRGFMKLEVTQP